MMISKSKNEWFELDKPIGEPKKVENYREECYWIERVVKTDGEIVWFGLGTNWVSKDNSKTWKYLGTDETIQMIPETKNDRGEWVGGHYPEGRHIWIDCDEPIYETLYKKLK